MADFKVVFRADGSTLGEWGLLWEPGCPVMLQAVQVSRDTDSGVAYLQVRARNISGGMIRSVVAMVTIRHLDGGVESLRYEDLDADIAPGVNKALKPQLLGRGDIEAVAMRLTIVDAEIGKWETSDEPIAPLAAKPLLLSERAAGERERILSEAGVSPKAFHGTVQDCGSWWVCACGQTNVGSASCCECGADKALLKSAEDEHTLMESADRWEEAQAAAAAEERDTRYKNAIADLNSQDPWKLKKASETLASLGDWEDASAKAAEASAKAGEISSNIRKKKNRTRVVVLLLVFAAIIGMLFAMGKANEAKTQAAMDNFVGTWTLESGTGEDWLSADSIDAVRKWGCEFRLTISEDRTCSLGAIMPNTLFTWDVGDNEDTIIATSKSSKLDEAIGGRVVLETKITMKLEDGKIHITPGDSGLSMTFVKSGKAPSGSSASAKLEKKKKAARKALLGTWRVKSSESISGGIQYDFTEEEIEALRSSGELLTMTFNKDGTASYGTGKEASQSVKWDVVDEKGTAVLVDRAVVMKLVDDKLRFIMFTEGNMVTFVKSE